MGWVVNTMPWQLYSWERPGTHCVGGWFSPRASLDGCGKSHPTGIPPPDRPECSESLYWLRCPGRSKQNFSDQCFGNGKFKGSALWIVGTSTLFHRFGSLWLLSLPKTKTLPRCSAFFFESKGDCSCRGYFADLTKNHYRDGIMALEHRWNKCISLKGDYVEK